MTAQVPIGRTWTLYPIVGDLFAWWCVAALIIAVGVAVARVTVGA